jgi:nicotinic acid mononucleotide adenylyltransferase
LRNAAGEEAPLYLLPGVEVDISASEIREQIFGNFDGQRGEPEFLSSPVSEYIRVHGLYR